MMFPSLRVALAAMMLLAVSTAGARTAADAFSEAPSSVLPLLRPNTRLDMLDYFNHSMPNTSQNRLGGEARILECAPNRLLASVSRDATVEIALVPVKNDTVTVVIETVLTPLADSSVSFFDSKWNKLNVKGIPGSDTTTGKKKKAAADEGMVFMAASYDTESNALVFRNTTEGYYTQTDRPEWLSDMPTKIIMRFDGKKLIPLDNIGNRK